MLVRQFVLTGHDDLHWVGNEGAFFWQQVPYRVLDVWGRWDTSFYVSIGIDSEGVVRAASRISAPPS